LETGAASFMRGYLAGLTLSTAGSSSTFSVAAGIAVDSTQADFMKLASSISKTTSSWAVGSGNGALDTGSIAASTWYHAYLIKRTDTGVVDVLVSLSATSPTMPTNYSLSRRIGAMKTNGSSQWTAFVQLGDEFLWSVPIADILTSSQGTTAILYTLSVPTGVQVWALLQGWSYASGGFDVLFTSPDQADTAPTSQINTVRGNANNFPSPLNIRTNTSAQIRARSDATSTQLNYITQGWIDRRGRDSECSALAQSAFGR